MPAILKEYVSAKIHIDRTVQQTSMTLFDWLLVGHLVGDFLLQNRWMAEKKGSQWLPLFIHAAVYTWVVYLMSLYAGGISWRGVVIIFLAHLILDRREFVAFWMRHVTRADSSTWLAIAVDQAWHIVILAIATRF
jgi:hypothetical protein